MDQNEEPRSPFPAALTPRFVPSVLSAALPAL